MDKAKRERFEKAGFKATTVKEFLGLTDEENELVELRVKLGIGIVAFRTAAGMTQKQLAVKLKTSQPRVVKIEHGLSDVSLDQMMRAFFAVGGTLGDLVEKPAKRAAKPRAVKV